MRKAARIVEERPTKDGKKRSLYYSILFHAILILVVIVGIDWKTRSIAPPGNAPPVMNATAVDAKKVAAEVDKLKHAEQDKAEAEKKRQREAEKKLKTAHDELEKLKQEQQEERRKKEAENERLDVEREKLEQAKEEAAERTKQAEVERKHAEQAAKKAADEKQKQEALAEEDAKKNAADEKKHAEEEKKAKAAEKKKTAEEQKKRDAAKAEQALKDALAAEEAEQQQAGEDATELARYVAKITAAVTNAFVYPDRSAGLKCTLLVRVVPGGEVVEAKVVESSGNPVFDRQAENAVRKASPLPVPEEARLFQQMREFKFVFAPES